ncbi:MAG: hypothetical protein ACC661_10385, partial [Verrucomicrobiales bacterium]
EIGPADLGAFANALPDSLYGQVAAETANAPRPFEQRIAIFGKEDFVLRADGEIVAPRLVGTENRIRTVRDEITGDPLPEVPGQKRQAVVALTLSYPLEGTPRMLSFSPPASGDGGLLSIKIGIIAYHRGVAINDFRYLGRREILYLDWEDPWYSKFRNPNFKRRFSAPVQGFLYMEPFEVRKEIVARVVDLEEWIDLGLGEGEFIPAAAQPEIARKAAEFLLARSPVTIDGKRIEPVLDRAHFLRRSLRQTTVVDPPEDLPRLSATLGVIIIYPVDHLPEAVEMEWDLFTARTNSMLGVLTDEAGSLPQQVSPDFPTLRWKNFLTNPTVPSFTELEPPPRKGRLQIPIPSLLLALAFIVLRIRRGSGAVSASSRGSRIGSIALLAAAILLWPVGRISLENPLAKTPVPGEAESRALLEGLLRNTYLAFDHREENLIYDTLARSVAGDLLTEVYLDIRRALELQNQGGARAKVKTVKLGEAQSRPRDGGPAFVANCTWTVAGAVGHWGHVHERRNQYRAEITVSPEGGSWKITALELLDEQRL